MPLTLQLTDCRADSHRATLCSTWRSCRSSAGWCQSCRLPCALTRLTSRSWRPSCVNNRSVFVHPPHSNQVADQASSKVRSLPESAIKGNFHWTTWQACPGLQYTTWRAHHCRELRARLCEPQVTDLARAICKFNLHGPCCNLQAVHEGCCLHAVVPWPCRRLACDAGRHSLALWGHTWELCWPRQEQASVELLAHV